ncbi:MAG: ribosome small subunit-dependent GTPase A [Bacteroidales bacterium]|nr:ribosome small subunit-dependent GTPase A [Bacteroidales bacterium]NLM92828.1 ribosome small subunit-dependent GTPase A [Bacteroidales bacterium]
MKGIITKSTGSWYTIMDETGKRHECRLRGKFKMSGIQSTNPLAVGDHVGFTLDAQEGTGIITSIEDRKNYIIRKATNLSRRTHIIAANLDQALIIATLAEPRTSTGFIDRFLVTCEAYSIPAVIVFNKADLYDAVSLDYVKQLLEMYNQAGYPGLVVSASEKDNLEAFSDILKGKTTLLSGHSGVGKSTLINAIEPGLNLKVQTISQVHLKGRHTTTFAEMFQLSNGGFIIDTPGIKEFGLVDFEPWELSHYFPEMRELFNKCRFDNCTHHNEPGCRVKEEVEHGNISILRYQNYLNMLLGEDTRA